MTEIEMFGTLSFAASWKYEADGGPKFSDLVETMRRLHAPLNETLALIDMLAFNYLIGNADAHAKNYSVVYRDGKSALAPIYDAVSTVVYEDLSRDFAMSIGGEMSIDRINRSSFESLAAECSVSSKLILARLDGLAGRIVDASNRLASQVRKEYPASIYDQIVDTISSQVAHIAR